MKVSLSLICTHTRRPLLPNCHKSIESSSVEDNELGFWSWVRLYNNCLKSVLTKRTEQSRQ